MKLLRLTTNDSECNFDNILNSDLIINHIGSSKESKWRNKRNKR